MPTALCECGKAVHWRNQRGVRLADLHCECGKAGLKAATWTKTGYVLREPSAPRGAMCKCAICGRRRRVPGGGKLLKEATQFRVYFSNTGAQYLATEYREETRDLKEGDVVCWHHSPTSPIFLGARP